VKTGRRVKLNPRVEREAVGKGGLQAGIGVDVYFADTSIRALGVRYIVVSGLCRNGHSHGHLLPRIRDRMSV
jgi:hypothetical protein